jgi:integrase
MKTLSLAVVPTTENRTVPLRLPNAALRTREHLTLTEVEKLIEAAKRNRWGHRDALMILLAFRHGLRAGEVVDLRWEQIDFNGAVLHVRRIKNGSPSTHPLTGRELRALRQHQREGSRSPFVFVSERGAPLNAAGFSRMVERAGKTAGLGLKAHANMLRHACGYALANAGHDTRALTSVSRPSKYPEHGEVFGARARALREVLAGLARRRSLAVWNQSFPAWRPRP